MASWDEGLTNYTLTPFKKNCIQYFRDRALTVEGNLVMADDNTAI